MPELYFRVNNFFRSPGSFFPAPTREAFPDARCVLLRKTHTRVNTFLCDFQKTFSFRRRKPFAPRLPARCVLLREASPSVNTFFCRLEHFFRAVKSPRPVRRADRVNRHLSIHCQSDFFTFFPFLSHYTAFMYFFSCFSCEDVYKRQHINAVLLLVCTRIFTRTVAHTCLLRLRCRKNS